MSYAAAQPPFGAYGPYLAHLRHLPPVRRLVGLPFLAALGLGCDGPATAGDTDESSGRGAGRWGMHGQGHGYGPFGSSRGWSSGKPPWASHGRGGGFPFGPWAPPQKARRGDIRSAILSVLADGPRNGYQIIGEIALRTDDAWRPSPGSIYPTLSQLEDEGLVRATEAAGKRVFELTEAGRAYVAEHPDEMSELWETRADAEPDEWRDTFDVFKQVAAATWQVMQTGSSAQRAEARTILGKVRRELYRVLGEGSAAGSARTETTNGEDET